MKAKHFLNTIASFFKKAAGRKRREIFGWVVIIVFAYLYLFQVNNVSWLKGRTYAFPFLLALTAMILVWLMINKKKQ